MRGLRHVRYGIPVRPTPWFSLCLLLLLCCAAADLEAQCNLTLTATPSSISVGETSTLQASVPSCFANRQVRFDFSPTVSGATVGTAAGPDANGISTVTYTAPSTITTSTKVTVTATSLGDPTKSDTATLTLSPPPIDVGTGAPNPSLQNAFITSFVRKGFNYLVSLPPVAGVRRLGNTGYVQEFNDAAKSGARLALATASSTAPASGDGTTNTVVQLYADLYSYYSSVGASTAG